MGTIFEIDNEGALRVKAVRSEKRSYEGPFKGREPDITMFIGLDGETLFGMKQAVYEALGEPEYVEITAKAVV